MKPELIIIRYGEIGLKKNITRRFFENILIQNIKKALQKQNINFEIKRKRARIYLFSNQIKECLQTLDKIFGITSFSPAYKTNSDKRSLEQIVIKITKNKITKDTRFALKVNRTGNHDFTSQDIAVYLGKIIQNKTKAPVDLSNPDVKIFVEIIDKEAFLFFKKINGQGGLPLGTQGKILAYIDSKESILAAWYLMRRGCKPFFLVSEDKLYKSVKKITENWFCDPSILLGQPINIEKYAKQKKCDAVVTGYRVKNIKKIKQLTDNITKPVIHPLIGFKAEEIGKKSKSMGL